jgi:hypothetical protein
MERLKKRLSPSPKLKFAKNLLYNIKQWQQLWNFLLHACALYPLPCIDWGPKYSPDPSPSFNNPLAICPSYCTIIIQSTLITTNATTWKWHPWWWLQTHVASMFYYTTLYIGTLLMLIIPFSFAYMAYFLAFHWTKSLHLTYQ